MNKRSGFTLIELVLVLGILAILLGLLLSGIQKVRSAAARLQCAGNLRQIGLACLSHHDVQGALPPGYAAFTCADPLSTSPGWGWASYLLPYLGEEATYQRIQFKRPIENPVNVVRTQVVRLYLCPADPVVASFCIFDFQGNYLADVAPISYASCSGYNELNEVPGPDEGVFYRNSHIRLADISDGTSTTLMIGDRAWSHAMAGWAGAVHGGIVRGGPLNPWRSSPVAAYPAPNFPCIHASQINGDRDPDGSLSLDEFYGNHTGGVNALFADGGIHFLRQDMNRAVLKAMSTRAGGEAVDLTDF